MKAVRNFLHYFISLLMWILFGYYWYVVSGRKISWGTFQALAVLGLVSLLGLAVTTLWIRHNQRLARRNRRSQAPPQVREDLTHDYLGRPVKAPADPDLQRAKIISIDLDDQGRKVYAVSGEVAP